MGGLVRCVGCGEVQWNLRARVDAGGKAVQRCRVCDEDLRPEDLILELDGTPLSRVEDLQRLMVAELIGTEVEVRVLRQGRELELALVPDELD